MRTSGAHAESVRQGNRTMVVGEATDAPAIEVCGLTKDYGDGRGVFDVSFSVRRGEVFGFLGPNGAGKTVTMRHLMGFLRPDRGVARIEGLDCFARHSEVQRHVGYLPGELACMEEMTGGAFIELMAKMRGLGDLRRAHELIERFQLDPTARIRRMSKGTKQKVGIVVAFMARPDILLLDEPTSGLDPLMQSTFIDLVCEERDRGATVLLSSHLFEEIERTCERVAFIRAGRLAAVERMGDVRNLRGRTYDVTFADSRARQGFLAGFAAGQDGCRVSPTGERGVRIEGLRGPGAANTLLRELARYDVADLVTHEQTLEELFMHLYGGQAGATGSPETRPSHSSCKEALR